MSPLEPGTRSDNEAAGVSVVMPAYNAERYIADALRSIRAQTVSCRDIIVIDDGSTDGTVAVAKTFGEAIVVSKPHSGIAATLNLGLEKASGEFVAFLDADDRWTPRKTEIQLAALRDDPALSMVFGRTRRFLMTPEGERPLDILPGMTKVGGLFRREAFHRIGGFLSADADFIDWFSRAREAGLTFAMHDDVVFERRIHDTNTGILQRDAQRKGYHVALKAALDRRRGK